MVTKEECEAMGKIFVAGHKDGNGNYVRAYCRDTPENYPLVRREENPIRMEEHFPLEAEAKEHMFPAVPEKGEMKESGEPIAKRYKLPRSNLTNAKMIEKEIATEDKYVARDLKKQDFEDIPYQASRIEKDAEKESTEAVKLEGSQQVLAQSHYAKLKNKIAKREYRDVKTRVKKEKAASKRAIRAESES